MIDRAITKKSTKVASQARINSLIMTSEKSASHIGSCFSVIDILSVLFAQKILDKDRSQDEIILSKGHAAAGLYAVLDSFNLLDCDLADYCEENSQIYGHVNHHASSGILLSTGSLGHGLPFGVGVALANKFNKIEATTYVVVSDGELNEGTTWESALVAAHHELVNLVVVIDRNRIQSLGFTEETLKLDPIKDKWEAFGWEVFEIDGHNHEEILNACENSAHKPTCIVANTIKGKGVSFMEDTIAWHYKSANKEELNQAIMEIKSNFK